MYYAAINSYSTETSIGFANTWNVIGFKSKANRDKYVADSNCLATRAITSKELRKYGGKLVEIEMHENRLDN